jgi:ribonuclease P protein subunit RPR2
VAAYGLEIARKFPEELVLTPELEFGFLLHDVGKVAIPDAILYKPGALDEHERTLMSRHPVIGSEIVQGIEFLAEAADVVRSHHERWDGDGYPDGRAGSRIPQFARIASVADVYDAITSERPYRDAAPAHAGHAAIVAGSGTAFDPEVVTAFRKIVAPYPAGTEITLSDGRRGIVAAVPDHAPDQPVVRITHDEQGAPVDPFEVPYADLTSLGIELAA